LPNKKFGGGNNYITTEPSEYPMHRLTQNTSNAYARRGYHSRRSANLINAVEYGLLAMLIISLVSIGATLAGSKLNGAFTTVAIAMEESSRPQNIISFGQRTNRKGVPVEREVGGMLSALTPLPF